MQWAGYLELHGLYAAVHRGRMPEVGAGTPLVVLRAGVVADGSPRARQLGIRPGMPRHQVLRQAPDAVLLRFEDADYGPAVRAVWSACSRHSPQVEPVEPGGVFIGLGAPGQAPPRAAVARAWDLALRVAAGAAGVAPAEIDVVAGLATSKLVARAVLFGSGPGRPSSEEAAVTVVPAGRESHVLAPLPVEALWKAPPEAIARLRTLGLRRVGEVAEVGESALWPHLGPLAWQLVQWARGQDPEPVQALWPPRAHSWRKAFPEGVEAADLLPALAHAATALAAGLEAAGEACQTVRLHLEPASGAPLMAEQRLSRPQQRSGYLQQALLTLFRGLLAPRAGESPLHFLALQAEATDLLVAGRQQLTLWVWDRPDPDRGEIPLRLSRAIAATRARFPPRVLSLGAEGLAQGARRERMLQFYDPLRRAAAGRHALVVPGTAGHERTWSGNDGR